MEKRSRLEARGPRHDLDIPNLGSICGTLHLTGLGHGSDKLAMNDGIMQEVRCTCAHSRGSWLPNIMAKRCSQARWGCEFRGRHACQSETALNGHADFLVVAGITLTNTSRSVYNVREIFTNDSSERVGPSIQTIRGNPSASTQARHVANAWGG